MRTRPAALLVAATAAALLAPVALARIAAQQTYPTPVTGDESGFERIFDERTLDGWRGDPTYWRVENGALVGEVTPATLLKRNSFIVWQGGTTKDFELKLEFRISAQGNSGVNYRSSEVTDTPWAMKGYQF